MADNLYRFADRFANWAVTALLVVIIILCTQLFSGRREILGSQNQLLDGRRWYTPVEVQKLFTDLGPRLSVYAASELTLDVLYAASYGLLFSILLINTFGPRYDWLLFFPFLTVVFDMLENIIIAYMAFTFNGETTQLAWAAAVSTLLKSILMLVTLLVVLNGGLVELYRRRPAR